MIPAVVREIRAERGQREVLEDDAAQQPGGQLKRNDGEPDEGHEGDEPEAGGRQDRRGRAITTMTRTTPNTAATSRRCPQMNVKASRTPLRTLTSSIATTICVIR